MMWKGQLSWKVYIPSKYARLGMKLSELCAAIFGYFWNFIIYVEQDTAFENSLGNEPHGSKVVSELMASFLN
jgi:hypothetical protein